MATIPLRGLSVVGYLWQFWPETGNKDMILNKEFQNKLAEAFKSGMLVKLDGTPELVSAATGDTVGTGNDQIIKSASLYGVAVDDAPASGQAKLFVQPLVPGIVVEGNLVQGTDMDAPTNHTLVKADLNALVGIGLDLTAKKCYLVSAAVATAKIARVTKIGLGMPGDSKGDIGDINARVQAVVFLDIMMLGALST